MTAGPYVVNEASFDLPDIGLVDATVHHVEAHLPGKGTISLRVQRAPLPEEKLLESAVDEQLRHAGIRLRAHRVLFRRAIQVAGCQAIEVGVEWRGMDALVYTRQVHIDIGGTRLVLAGNAPMPERAACDALVDNALATFRLRG